eukprot:6200016-Pleurochrysis_carterae.AAC.3
MSGLRMCSATSSPTLLASNHAAPTASSSSALQPRASVHSSHALLCLLRAVSFSFYPRFSLHFKGCLHFLRAICLHAQHN